MGSREPACDLFMTRFRGLIDGYFGPGEAQKAWDTVASVYQLATTHAWERATNGPYTIDPFDMEEFIDNDSA